MHPPSPDSRSSPDSHSSPGVVELREDVPLKPSSIGGGVRVCAGGPRFIVACFAALTAATTLALLTQIYYGDYEVVPHGSVSSDAASCSGAGTDALKAGGGAMDAAVVAALCLASLTPQRTSLDASGVMLYWEYREWRRSAVWTAEWGAAGSGAEVVPGAGAVTQAEAEPVPRLVAALASLHALHGRLPWPRLLQSTIDLARADMSTNASPVLADYLSTLQHNTSAELSSAWSGGVGGGVVRMREVAVSGAGRWRVWAAGRGAGDVSRALRAALSPEPSNVDDALDRVTLPPASGAPPSPSDGVSTGMAVVDAKDTYLALVTGLSAPYGSGPVTSQGWRRDAPPAPLDLTPLILADSHVCGTRYVVGGGASAAVSQAAAALAVSGQPAAVERSRLPAAINVVQQRGDALLSHADSRGGGLSSRF